MADDLQYDSQVGANQGKLLYCETGANLGKLVYECPCRPCCDPGPASITLIISGTGTGFDDTYTLSPVVSGAISCAGELGGTACTYEWTDAIDTIRLHFKTSGYALEVFDSGFCEYHSGCITYDWSYCLGDAGTLLDWNNCVIGGAVGAYSWTPNW